jgi:hypothetical protein
MWCDLVEEMLGPDNAVNGLAWRVPDGAAGEGLLVRLRLTLVALRYTLVIRGQNDTIKHCGIFILERLHSVTPG